MAIYIRLDAGHDRKGHPRRVFVIFDAHGTVREVICEGWDGNAPVKLVYPKHDFAGSFETTVKEYKALKAVAVKRGG